MAYSDDLTATHIQMHDLRPGMRLKPLQSHAPKVSDAEIDHIIARTLAEDRQIEARAALPAIASQDELSGLAGRSARRSAARGGAAAARMGAVTALYAESAGRAGPDAGGRGASSSGPREDLTGRRPFLQRLGLFSATSRPWAMRALLMVAMLAIAALMPWAIPLVLAAGVVAIAALVAAMGSDRMAGGLERVFHWLHAREPDRAERFRARVDRMATAMDALLDRLPERWTAGLYMADFSREALLPGAQDDLPDPFDRIAAEARGI